MHSYSALAVSRKAEFLDRWDGLGTSKHTQVVVVGATNRVACIDEAAIRRFSRSYKVDLPDEAARLTIIERTLRSSKLDAEVDLPALAQRTSDWSGSDLKELCRYSAQLPLRELMQSSQVAASAIAAALIFGAWVR